MREEYINRISEIHRLAMESHFSYMALITQGLENNQPSNNNISTNTTNLNDLNFSDIFRTALPPITIDLTNLFNTSLNPASLITPPTNEEIENACERLKYLEIPESERTTTICPIDRQQFQQNDNVLRIRHCKHYFREENLRQNFQNNSLCPLCRYNIISI